MKWLEKFSGTIYRTVAAKSLIRFDEFNPEKALRRSLLMIDPMTANEIRGFLSSHQTDSGGFMDKGGKSDLYYSLFGSFASEALDLDDSNERLKQYLDQTISGSKIEGVHLHCAVILISRLAGINRLSKDIRDTLNKNISKPGTMSPYTAFLSLLSYYYSGNYKGLYEVSRQLKTIAKVKDVPCTVVAANLVLQHCFGRPVEDHIHAIHSFYMKNGSFAAVKNAPVGDLLSTGVALYALKVAGADIRNIVPDCLEYVDSLYSGGGFCSTILDPDPDVEYTFYGLLALGALAA
jgi:hypothetical protein